jgi:hypothetical protein
MAEREKAIRGLELCAYDPDPGQEPKENRSCPECPYYRAGCSPQLIRDALALLKEQEPRVMTLDEVIHSKDWIWYEEKSTHCGWTIVVDCDEKWIGWEDLTIDQLCKYGETWRCWSARPTDEQRKAVAWNG